MSSNAFIAIIFCSIIALFLIVPAAPAQSDQRVVRALDAALAAALDDA